MKRRNFGLWASSSFAAIAVTQPARAQSAAPDPTLLTTTLTPMGGERAGNADGSIPAWTGGLTSQALPPNQPVDVAVFTDEAPLYAVNASNLEQYQSLLTPGTQAMMTKFGFYIKVFPTHRTAAAPQYVYDNTAKNVMTATLDPNGGRLGFTGAYGGVAFPIIDTSDPLAGGAQLIWNHLTAWGGYSNYTLFSPSIVVINGNLILSEGDLTRYEYPYYDPNGSLETFDGYYVKIHSYYKAPASVMGQEQVIWNSTNVNVNPDIVWTLLNGQGRVRKDPNEAFDAPNPGTNGISAVDESSCFYGNPEQYDWKYIAKQEMLVPYNCNALHYHTAEEILQPKFPNPEIIRWEKHRVWVVEATLHPGEHNVLSRRRFYIDEDSWFALLGEGYDNEGNLAKVYTLYNRTIPSMPATSEQGTVVFSLLTGNYAYVGTINYPPFSGDEFIASQPPSIWEPQQMSAAASF